MRSDLCLPEATTSSFSLSLGAEICLSQRSSYPKSHDWNRRNPFTGVPGPTFRKWNTKSIHHLHIYLLFIYSLCRIRCSSSSSDSRSGVDPAWKWLQKVPNKPFRNILTSKIATNQQAMNFWRCSQLCMQTWFNLQHAHTWPAAILPALEAPLEPPSWHLVPEIDHEWIFSKGSRSSSAGASDGKYRVKGSNFRFEVFFYVWKNQRNIYFWRFFQDNTTVKLPQSPPLSQRKQRSEKVQEVFTTYVTYFLLAPWLVVAVFGGWFNIEQNDRTINGSGREGVRLWQEGQHPFA